MMVDDDPLDLPACLDRRREREAEEINARTGFNEEEEARIREGCELSRPYWLDSLIYARAAEQEMSALTVVDRAGELDLRRPPVEGDDLAIPAFLRRASA